jgi:hypothetical protein
MPEKTVVIDNIRSIDDFTKTSELERARQRNLELERDLAEFRRQLELLAPGGKDGRLAVRETFHGVVTEVTEENVHLKIEDAHATVQLCVSRQDFAKGISLKVGDRVTVDTLVTIRAAILSESGQGGEGVHEEWRQMGEELSALSQRKPIRL